MSIELHHTIVRCSDKERSSRFLAEVLGLDAPKPVSHFVAVTVANDVTLDYDNATEIVPQHFAFLVSEDEFDAIFDRVARQGVDYFADPNHLHANQINGRGGGRGFYFSDPDGHNMEVFTKSPFG